MRSSKLRAFLIALMLLVFAAGLAFLLYPSLWGAAVDRKISLNAQGFLNRDETAPTIPEVIVTIDSPLDQFSLDRCMYLCFWCRAAHYQS